MSPCWLNARDQLNYIPQLTCGFHSGPSHLLHTNSLPLCFSFFYYMYHVLKATLKVLQTVYSTGTAYWKQKLTKLTLIQGYNILIQ